MKPLATAALAAVLASAPLTPELLPTMAMADDTTVVDDKAAARKAAAEEAAAKKEAAKQEAQAKKE